MSSTPLCASIGTDRTKVGTGGDSCPVTRAFDQIGSSWRLTVLLDLFLDGERRFNEIQRSTDASSHTLSRVLSELEDRNLVRRQVEAEGAIAVYYDLTPKGQSLLSVISELDAWADDWLDTQ